MNGLPQPAQLQLGRYTVVCPVGDGGMAEVFLAEQSGALGFVRRVCVKRVRPALLTDAQYLRMFVDEARIMLRVQHPNVVQVLDLVVEGSTPAIVMEYVDGGDLKRLLRALARQHTVLDWRVALYVAWCLTKALGRAHQATLPDGTPLGLIHRDISPGNVLLSRLGDVKLSDFGVARAAGAVGGAEDGGIRGNLAYMAPEVLTTGRADQRADIFGVGVVLWETLCSRRLFPGQSPEELAQQILHKEIPAPSSIRPEIPAAVDGVVLHALARDPQRRIASAAALEEALQPFVTATPHHRLEQMLAAQVETHLPAPATEAEWEPEQQLGQLPTFPCEAPEMDALTAMVTNPLMRLDGRTADDVAGEVGLVDNDLEASFFAQGDVMASNAEGSLAPSPIPAAPEPVGPRRKSALFVAESTFLSSPPLESPMAPMPFTVTEDFPMPPDADGPGLMSQAAASPASRINPFADLPTSLALDISSPPPDAPQESPVAASAPLEATAVAAPVPVAGMDDLPATPPGGSQPSPQPPPRTASGVRPAPFGRPPSGTASAKTGPRTASGVRPATLFDRPPSGSGPRAPVVSSPRTASGVMAATPFDRPPSGSGPRAPVVSSPRTASGVLPATPFDRPPSGSGPRPPVVSSPQTASGIMAAPSFDRPPSGSGPRPPVATSPRTASGVMAAPAFDRPPSGSGPHAPVAASPRTASGVMAATPFDRPPSGSGPRPPVAASPRTTSGVMAATPFDRPPSGSGPPPPVASPQTASEAVPATPFDRPPSAPGGLAPSPSSVPPAASTPFDAPNPSRVAIPAAWPQAPQASPATPDAGASNTGWLLNSQPVTPGQLWLAMQSVGCTGTVEHQGMPVELGDLARRLLLDLHVAPPPGVEPPPPWATLAPGDLKQLLAHLGADGVTCMMVATCTQGTATLFLEQGHVQYVHLVAAIPLVGLLAPDMPSGSTFTQLVSACAANGTNVLQAAWAMDRESAQRAWRSAVVTRVHDVAGWGSCESAVHPGVRAPFVLPALLEDALAGM